MSILSYSAQWMGGVRSLSAQDTAAAQLHFSLSHRHGSCDRPVPLMREQRITLHFPRPVRVALTSSEAELSIFISGRLVVVHALSRSEKGALDAPSVVSVTTELESGESFICQFSLTQTSQPQEQRPIELIRVSDQSWIDRTKKQVLEELKAILSGRSSMADKEVSQALEEWRKQERSLALLSIMGAPDLQISDHTPLRAQDHLIYVTLERAIIAQQELVVRFSLHNRSQDEFALKQVEYIPAPDAQPISMWSQRIDDSPTPMILKPNGERQLLSLAVPRAALFNGEIQFISTDGRKVHLELTSLEELQAQ